jgi:hypothetical protein
MKVFIAAVVTIVNDVTAVVIGSAAIEATATIAAF